MRGEAAVAVGNLQKMSTKEKEYQKAKVSSRCGCAQVFEVASQGLQVASPSCRKLWQALLCSSCFPF